MKYSVFYMTLSMIITLFFTVISIGILEFKMTVVLNNRVETALSSACFSGFAFYDLENYATRKALDEREERLIVLEDSSRVRNVITDLVIKNLRLNNDFTPKSDSYIIGEISIQEINIYNPDDLPVILEGREYNVTTIELVANIPFKMPLNKIEIKEKRIIVNADTFLVESQKNKKR